MYFNLGGHTGTSVNQPFERIDSAVNLRGSKEDPEGMLGPETWSMPLAESVLVSPFDHSTPQVEIDPTRGRGNAFPFQTGKGRHFRV